MSMSKDRQEYLKEYRKNNLKRIPLDVPFDFYEDIKLAADIENMSVNRYIRFVINKDLAKKKNEVDEEEKELNELLFEVKSKISMLDELKSKIERKIKFSKQQKSPS